MKKKAKNDTVSTYRTIFEQFTSNQKEALSLSVHFFEAHTPYEFLGNPRDGIVSDYFLKKVVPHKKFVKEEGEALLSHDWFVRFLNVDNEGLGQVIEKKDIVETFTRNLLIHDLSKFSVNEAVGYAFHDFKRPQLTQHIFKAACHHHKMNNPHHIEYWFDVKNNGTCEPLQMPTLYIGEMLADWLGESRGYGTEICDWLYANLQKMVFHERTAHYLRYALEMMGYNYMKHDTDEGYSRLLPVGRGFQKPFGL
jgi:hypothetical protein